jgi:hypothetical protein
MPMPMFKAESRKLRRSSENQFRQLLHALGLHPGLGTINAQSTNGSLVCQVGHRWGDASTR